MSHQNGRLARYTRWIFAGLFVGAAAGLLAPLLAKASPAVKEISAITSAEDYSSATVTFSVGAFSAPSGIGPLVPSDFSLTGTTATITSVTPVGSGSRTWDIAFSAPVAPHNAVLAVVANEVFESDGTAFPAQSKPVPLSATALSGLLTGLKSLDIPLYKETAAVGETPSVVNLPLVGGFFKNPGTDAEPAARGLDELLSGLSGISLGGSATQADLETALEGLAGVADAQFVGGGLTLAFDNTQTAATHTMSGAAGVDSLELSLKGEPSVALRLDGALRVLPSAGDIAVDAATAPFAIVLNSTAPVDLAAKMGFVGLSAPGASLAYSNARVSVDLGCTAGTTCAPSAMTSLVDVTGGTASLDIPKLTLTDGTGAHTYTPSGAPNLLEIDWTNLVDLKTAPTLANNLGNVANFANIDLDRAVASLQFMSAWLAEAEKFQAMGADLPLIGGKLSEQTRIAAALAEKIQAVTTGIEDDVEKKGVEVTAQDLVARLCTAGLVDVGTGSCDTALTPLAITPDHLDYKIDLDVNRTTGAGKDNIPLPTKLGLGIGDKLDGLALSEAAGPINLTSSGGLQFTLGLDLRPDATLMSIFGLEADDLDDDGTANGSDPDADGDGRDDATVDEDVDADGLPEKYALKPGDLCRGVGGLFGMAMERFAWLNGHALTGADRAVQIAACDDLAAPGTTVKYETGPDTDDPKDGNPNTVATATLTANDVCYAGATLFLVPDGELTDPRAAVLNTFRTFNGYGADNAACAAALAAGTSKFKYDNDLDFGSPVRLAHRAYVGESSTPVLNQAANLTGTGIEIAGRLGFLDIKFLGNVTAAPTASVKMVDPKTGADDDRISLIELAKAADADDLDSIINLTMGGPIDAHFALTNTSVLTTAAHLDVLGSFSALDNAAADIFEFHTTHLTDASSLTADRIHVAQDLGELLNFEDVGTPQIRQLIRRFAESMATMAGSSALDHEIPFIGVRPAEMLDFAKKWQAVGEQTLAGDPQTLSAFASALKGALASQGFSSDLDLDIDDHDFLIGLKGSSELTRSYPFSFDLSGFPIAPADGGATVNAKAALTFAPTLGMRFAPGGSGGLSEGDVFVEDPDFNLKSTAKADIFGTVHLGPVVSGIQGNLDVKAELDVDVDTGSDNRLTIDELVSGFTSGSLVDVEFDGPVSADLAVTNPRGSIHVSGDLSDPGGLTITHDLNLASLTIDVNTLFEGIVETSGFVGRILSQSDDLHVDLPIIGDALQGAADLGSKMAAISSGIKALKTTAGDDGTKFLNGLQAALNSALGGCGSCVTVSATNGAGQTVAFDQAENITMALNFGYDRAPTSSPLAGGIGIDGVFEARLDKATGGLEYGYNAGFTMGINRTDGFFVQGANGGQLLELYAGINATGINANVDLFGVPLAKVENGSVLINGGASGLGPRHTAGGLSVKIPKLSLRDLSNRGSDVDQAFTAGFNLNVDVDLPLSTTSSIGPVPMPTINVPVFFDWSIQGTNIGTPHLNLGSEAQQVTLSVDSLIGECKPPDSDNCTGLIAPVWKQLGKYNPLGKDPIKSVLQTQIPVLEQNFMELAATLGVPGMNFLDFLVSLDGTVPNKQAGGDVKLGWVEVLPTLTIHQNVEPWQCQDGGLAQTIRGLFRNLFPLPSCPPSHPTGTEAISAKDIDETPPLVEAGPLSVYIPLLQNPAQALLIVLGPDVAPPVKLIEVRFGSGDVPFNIGPQINFSVTLFDLDIGFMKGGLKVAFAGGLGAQFRVGIGYDTAGLRPGANLIDGFYLVDFKNSQGVDVQEISAGGFVAGTIDGYFSVLGDVASVRFRGSAGINLTAGLDFFDESVAIPAIERGDGRFHLYEMAKVMDAHEFPGPGFEEPDYTAIDKFGFELDDVLCIFQVGVDFSAYVSFSGKAKVLGVTVFNESFDENFPIIHETISCPITYRVAQLIDGQLVLNAGPKYAGDRFDNLGDIAEKLQLKREGDLIKVKGVGGPLAGGKYPELEFKVGDIKRGILADLGGGDDEITVVGNLDVPMTVLGGPGNDILRGSNGDDTIDGGDGVDELYGFGANDTLRGGAGDDKLDGGEGNDAADGGAGDDAYGFVGAWGNDNLTDPVGAKDKLDFGQVTSGLTGDSFYGEGTITAGTNAVHYFERDFEQIFGGTNADRFSFKPSAPNGLYFNGQAGNDITTVNLAGKTRAITIDDSSGVDKLIVNGTAADDTFLFRGQPAGFTAGNATTKMGNPYEKNMPPAPADHGFVAMISPTKLVDRINHAVAIENVQVEGLVGNDTFAFDDNVAGDTTNVSGGVGDDKFFVGQIFGEAKALGFDTGLPVTPATKCRGDLDNLTPARCIGLRDSTVGIGDPSDWFGLRDTTRGFLSNGVTHPATLNGGDGNDFFQVYSNQAKLIMNGDNDDDTFILRAFALEGSKSAAIMEQLGVPMEVNLGAGVDYVEYAKNAAVEVHGGDGFDTLMFVGTEFQDGILVSNGTAQICHVKDLEKGILDTDECSFETVLYDEIESVGIQALGGNDLILILSTGTPGGDRTQMKVFGGEHDDVIYIGRDNTSEYSKKWLHGGDLSGIQDPVTVYGESDPLFDEDISTAITLPGETAGTAEPPSPLAGGTKFGDVGIIDATQHNAGVTGRIDQIKQDDVDVQNLTGFGMGTGATIKGVTLPGGVVFNAIDFVDVRLGQGNDSFVVEKTDDIKRDLNGDDELEDIPGFLSTAGVLNATPAKVLYGAEVVPLLISGNNGSDTISLKTADAAVRVVGGAGDDVVNVGSVMPAKPGTLETIHALVDVIGGIGTDTLNLDDSAETESQKLSVRQASVHGLGLHPLGVTYAELETLDVDMGTANEVANVRGTSATTTIHGNAGDERYYVSDVANLDQDTTTDHLLGTLDDIDGALTLDSGAGRHLLMVSDEDTATGDTAAVINATSITGLAPAGITYTTSGSWADGVTVWASQHDDTINLDSTHLTPGVRTVSTLNAGDGNDALTVDLVDGVDGFSVVNGEEGNDTINGASSTLPLVLFGGPGNDDIDGGHAADIVLGDLGWVRYGAADETVLGGGGPGDRTDGVIRPVEQIESRSLATGGTDDIATGDGNDVAFGGTGNDTMDSGANDDVALGDAGEYRRTWPAPQYRSTGHLDAIGGNDTINAGDGRDFVLGQHGNDAIDGGPADDVIAGGHNLAGGLDGADVVHGGSGRDVISGDNAKLDWTPPWRLYDVATVSNPTPPTGSGSGDELHGDDGDDVIFGQAGNDLISGDSGLDDIEGNAGSDNITGNAGQDNIAGGGSANDGLIVTTRIGTGLLDSADTIDGGDDADVIGGDNIRILRVLTATGAPVVDAANGSFVRDIRHFDVAIVGGPAVPSSTNGGDTIDSGGQDDIVFSQGGNDTTRGGAGDDWLEGNDGLDTVFGGGGSDDVLGGGSANDGIIIPTRTGKGLLDDGDRLFGDSRANAGGDADDGHDVVLGDNGRIDRPRLSNGTWTMLNPVAGATYANRVLRVVVMADASPGATSGSDYMRGNGGEDDLYGQFDDGSSSTLAGVGCIDNELVPGAIAGDLICGDAGEDGIVADQGTIVSVKAENMSASAQRVQTNSPFIDETIYARGTVVRVVTLSPIAVGGDDVVFGGDGRDSIHAGAGDDMANAGPGDDAIFGGDGADALWGDIGHDRAYGGFGTDFIDVKPRANVAGIANDGPRWFVVAPFVDRDNVKASTNWSDTHYGGWDADALQADEGGAGPRPGDRLVDWQGAYNVFYVCEGAYGAGRILREFSPNMHDVWQQLAAGDGATTVTVEGASGEVELALVANKEIKDNTNPRHPDHPGHFTCEGS